MAQYVEPAGGSARVIDFVDADSEKWRAYGRLQPFPYSWIYRLEADRLARYEARKAIEFDASVFVSQREADIVRRRAPGSELSVIPLGVDVERFRPERDRPQREAIAVFTGVMNYFPNVDAVTYFARDILPRVRQEIPHAQFRIVGRDPSAAVRRLAQLPGVVVTGSVPDVRPHLADAALGVAPFRISRGAQSKVLEAMASGLPVVGTRVAFQGLAIGGDAGIRTADSPDAFAREVVTLLGDPDLRRDLGERARRYVERHHRWEEIGAMFEALLVGVVEGRRAARAAGGLR
jgi:sugar transferase (PEP-CTERM/EpsH1 system associated)